MIPYVTTVNAETFFETRIGCDAWIEATPEEQYAALCTSTRAINRLSFIGQKTDATQENEWPRGGDTEIPDSIVVACCEEALSLLEGRDPVMEEENLRTLSQTYANTKMAFDPKVLALHIINGITSPIAWRCLRQYLRGVQQVELERV